MGEEIAVENGRISDFQGLMALTLDRVIKTNEVTNTYRKYLPAFVLVPT